MRQFIFIGLVAFISCQEKPDMQKMEQPAPPPYQPTYTDTFLMGQFDPETHPDFVEIDIQYADRTGRYMHKEAYTAFTKMHAAAYAEGIQFKIISAVRNFHYQKGIWERKWNGQTLLEGKTDARTIENPAERARAILRFSSMPGTSRHHWGTDIDINSLNNSYFDSGKGKKEFDWLTDHAQEFGFCRSYTAKSPEGRNSGYEEEKWHWSYAPLSRVMLKDASLLLKDEMITGFDGSETASELQVVKNYILGVDLNCVE